MKTKEERYFMSMLIQRRESFNKQIVSHGERPRTVSNSLLIATLKGKVEEIEHLIECVQKYPCCG